VGLSVRSCGACAVLSVAITVTVAVPARAGTSDLQLQSVDGVHANAPAKAFAPTWTYNDDPGGTANWSTPSGTSTYTFPVPSTIPAGGVEITLQVKAEVPNTAPDGTRWAPAMGIHGLLVQGGDVTVSTIAEKGGMNPKEMTQTVKLLPTGSSPETLTVGLQNGPVFTYTFVAVATPPPTTHPPGGSSGSLSPPASFCAFRAVRASVKSGAPFARTACALHPTVTVAQKAEARVLFRHELKITGFLCAMLDLAQEGSNILHTSHRGLTDLEIESLVAFAGQSKSADLLFACFTAMAVLADTAHVITDPADPAYRLVARPPPPQVSTPGGTCPASISPAACVSLLAARATYTNALAMTASVGQALAVTINRFAGARRARSVSGAFLQNAVGKIYAGELAGALASQQTAGAALAAQLRADHLDVALNGRATKALVSLAISPTVLSNALLDKLAGAGVTANRAQARRLLTGALTSLSGTLDLATALSGSLPGGASNKHYRSITLRELAGIVRALGAQHAVTGAASQTLIADLAAAKSACANAPRRSAAMQTFITDAGVLVYEAAAKFLQFGAQPLSAATASPPACK
jgi:hypothetical protein